MDYFGTLSYGDQMEMGNAGLTCTGDVDPETLNEMIGEQNDQLALARQVSQYGQGHGRDAYTQSVTPGAPAPAENTQPMQETARAEVLLPNPERVPQRDPKKEPTYRLRKAMGLV